MCVFSFSLSFFLSIFLFSFSSTVKVCFIFRRHVSEEQLYSVSNSTYNDLTWHPVPYATGMPDKQLRTELYQSVYNPGYNPLPEAPHIWAKHSNALNRIVAKQNTNPRRWSNEEVMKFIQSVPNCKDIASAFRKHVSCATVMQ